MKLKFLSKTLESYSVVLSNGIPLNVKLNDCFDCPNEDARRIMQDFPNDFCIANNEKIENSEMPKAIIKYIIVNKRNNVLF